MSSYYKFTISDPANILMYEWDDGVWQQETLSLNETLTLNADNSISLAKNTGTYIKVEVFKLTPDATDAADVYYQSNEYYTQLDGTLIGSEPEDDEIDDGIEDDQDGDGSDDDMLDGSDDDDLEHGGSGDDSIDGGLGDDDLFGDEGDDSLDGGDGDDILRGGIGFDVLSGGVGDDDLYGEDDDDVLEGASGADLLDGGLGDDDLAGGEGNDTLVGQSGDDYLEGNDGVDNLNGGAGNDELYAGSGNDYVDAGLGDDLIVGGDGAGDDIYVGGVGSDTVKYSSAAAAISVNLTLGTAKSTSADAGIGSDKLLTVENVIGGDYNDTLTGGGTANKLEGGNGDDVISGMAGADTLLGNAGNDNLNGGKDGDTLIGGAGNDLYVLDHINDTASEITGEGTDSVQSSVSVSGLMSDDVSMAYIGGFVENITLTGTAALKATGNALDNNITGNNGANLLKGGDGADILMGGLGKDTLFGNAGADVFKYAQIADSKAGASYRDVISDFAAGDKIDLSGIDAKAGFGANDSFTFLGATAPTTANCNGAVWFKAGILYASNDADVAAEFEIALTGVSSISAGDLIL